MTMPRAVSLVRVTTGNDRPIIIPELIPGEGLAMAAEEPAAGWDITATIRTTIYSNSTRTSSLTD
jgi:hypothetical protein